MKTTIKFPFLIPFLFISSVTFSQSAPVSKNQIKTIAFYLQDRIEVLDFAGPLEVFSYAGYEVFTVSKSKKAIKAQGVLTIKPDYTLKNAPKADILAFFGGNASSAYNDPEVVEWIRQQTETEYYFSVCTGAFMLAEAGILENKVATTFHDSLEKLEAEYPDTDVRKNVRFVDNGKVITTAGISAGIDGALHLVAKLQGLSVAKRTAYFMEYDNWLPGNGLVLSADNSYQGLPTKEELQEYTGKYQYKDGQQIAIEVGARNGELNVLLKGRKYPHFYEQKDKFSDISGELIYFKRDEDNQITGYTLEDNGLVYKKEIYICTPCGGDCDTLQFNSSGVCTHCAMELVEKSVLDEYYSSIENFQINPEDSVSSHGKEPVHEFRIPNGQIINSKEFNSFILSQMDSLKIVGLSIAIISEGKVVYQNALGLKNIETGEQVDSKTLFEAASLTKPVFAYTVIDMVKME